MKIFLKLKLHVLAVPLNAGLGHFWLANTNKASTETNQGYTQSTRNNWYYPNFGTLGWQYKNIPENWVKLGYWLC